MNIAGLAQQWSQAGAAGQIAFNNLATSVMTSNTQLKQTYSLLENFKTTLTNTIKWNIASGAINSFTASISNAFNYVRALDSSLTDIRIVTGQSRDEMAKFAIQANDAAQALGRQTKEYTNAALAYYQQGLNAEEVQARTAATLKAQNITGAGTEMTDYLTAVWNGFQINIEESELAVDKLAAVADSSASNMAELAVGMSKVAATANNMGVDIDQLTAQLATIIATTRQAPETVGNALKTIYARINDIKAGTDDAEISLGNYTKKMASLGFSVLDADGKLKDTGVTMTEIGERWQTLTREQQIYLAQTMAGQRQMNNLIALFDNWEKYSEMLNVSLNSQGTLNEKNARYMDSITAHMNQFKAATEGLQDALIDEEAIKDVIDAGTALLNLFNNFLTSIGGVKTASIALSSILLKTFSSNIANGISNLVGNLRNAADNAELLKSKLDVINNFANVSNNGLITQLQGWAQQITQLQQSGALTGDQANVLNDLMQRYNALQNEKIAYEELIHKAEAYYELNTQESHDFTNMTKEEAQSVRQALDNQIKGFQDRAKWLENNLLLVERTKQASEAAFNNASSNNLKREADSIQNLNERLRIQLNLFKELYATRGQSMGLTFNKDQMYELQNLVRSLDQDMQSDMAPQEYAEKYFEAFRKIVAAAKQAAEEARQGLKAGEDGAVQDAEQAGNEIREAIIKNIKAAELRNQIQGIVKGLGGIAGFASGIRSIATGLKTLQDETMGIGEKMLSATSAFAMGATMILTNIDNIKKGFSLARTAIINYAAANAVAKMETAGLTEEEIANLIATEANTIAHEGLAAAIWKAAVAWLATPVGQITTAIAALTAVIYVCVKAYQANTNAAEEAAEQARKAQEQYSKIKDEYEKLKSSIEDYTKAQEAIDALTTGTQEWRDAIADANQQVLELLATYPELAKYITNTNGRLTIETEGLDAVTEAAKARMSFANNAALNAQNQSRIADNLAAATQLAHRATGSYDNEGNFITVSGDQVLKILEARQNVIGSGQDLTSENIKQALIDAGHPLSEAVIDAVLKLGIELETLQASIDANTKANDLVNQTIAHNVNVAQNNQAYQRSEYQDAIDIQTNAVAQKLYQSILSELQYGGNFDAVKTEYARNMGYTVETNFLGSTILKNASGEEVEVARDVILQSVAISRALKTAGENIQLYTDNLNSVLAKVTTENEKNAIASFMGGQTGDLSSLTEKEMEKITAIILSSWEQLGFSLRSDAQNAVDEASQNYQNMWSEIGSSLPEQAKIAFDRLLTSAFKDTNHISPQAAKNIEQAIQQIYDQAGQTGVTALTQLLQNAGQQAGEVAQVLTTLSKTSSIQDIQEAFSQAEINLSDFGYTVQDIADMIQAAGRETFDSIAAVYKDAKEVVDKLSSGDSIDEKAAAKLEKFGLDLNQFFIMGAEGERVLISSAKELQDAVAQIQMSRLYNDMRLAAAEATKLGNALAQTFSEENLQGPLYEGEGSNINVNTDRVKDQLAFLTTISENNLGEVSKGDLETWQKLIERGTATAETYDAISAAVEKNISALDGLEQKQQDLVQEYYNSAQALASFRLALDKDVDQTAWENLTKTIYENGSAIEGLSDHLKEDRIAAAEVAQAILRFDDAIQDVTKNYEDWEKALRSSSVQEQSEAIEQLRDTYADLLDLDGDSLSDSFLSSEKNLQNLKAAAEGSAEAYNELMEAVQQDILSQVKIEPDFDLTGFEEGLNQVQAELDAMNYQQLEIGANLDTGNFIAACEQMINAAGMTAQQATDYLASMGVDAQVIENEDPVTETHETGEYTASPHTVMLPYSIPYGDGMGVGTQKGSGYVTVPDYTPITESFDTTSVHKAVSLKVTSAHKSSGGGFKHTQAAHGGGSKGGSGKKGGGGGGGGSKQPKKKTTEPFKSKIDPYHDVNIKIGDVQEGLNKLEKQRDKLIGKDAIANLGKQINLMEKEKELLKEKAAIAQEELQKQGQELANLGAIFNKNGDIANYKQLLADKQEQINKAIEIANGLEGDEQEAYLKYVDQLKKEYKELEDGIKNFDETKQLLDDLGEDYRDLIDKQIEKAIEAFDLEINVKLDLQDAEKEFNDFRKKVIDKVKDDQHGALTEAAARNYSQYYNVDNKGRVGGLIPELTKHVQDIQRETEIVRNGGFSQIYGDNLAAAQEDLKKYNDELMKALEEAQDVIDETHDHFLDAIDAIRLMICFNMIWKFFN